MEDFRNFLEWQLFKIGSYELRVSSLLSIVGIFFIAWLLVWLFRKYLKRKQRRGTLDAGKVYALGQIAGYFIYIGAIMAAIDALGFSITVLIASSTALLVGLGLGLQDLFKDMVAGFILLFERTVTAGDIVEITGIVGKVKEVGLRTTSLITREDIVLIVPNSKLTTDHVINWSQNHRNTRFRVDVGVAYGSDTELVRKLLQQSADKHKDVLADPAPYVFFQDFGNSSLDFSLYFFSRNLFRIERTKSELRFKIDQLFREHGVRIPFPQRDVWLRQEPKSAPGDENSSD